MMMIASSIEELTARLGAQTAEHPAAGRTDFPKEDFIWPIETETTSPSERPELMSPAEVTRLMELDATHNPVLAAWWRGIGSDDLVGS